MGRSHGHFVELIPKQWSIVESRRFCPESGISRVSRWDRLFPGQTGLLRSGFGNSGPFLPDFDSGTGDAEKRETAFEKPRSKTREAPASHGQTGLSSGQSG